MLADTTIDQQNIRDYSDCKVAFESGKPANAKENWYIFSHKYEWLIVP